ncbi:hypothetical protein J3R82DRAFT_9819 [Butyriboletus roseoflavus]|nr:hypothetical protein J3R82DRAFT_9819 [Butyriboletus roseoflavus]
MLVCHFMTSCVIASQALSLTCGQTTLLLFGQLTDWEPSCRTSYSVFSTREKLRATSGANPLFTSGELVYQIQATKASVVVTHPELLLVTLAATRTTNLAAERIILFNVDGASYGTQTTVQNVIDEGLASTSPFQERVLRPGEGRTKVAFLNFSSGTTGRPKVWILKHSRKAVAIPHFAPIANVIQLAAHHRVNDPSWEGQRFRPGDICCAGRSPRSMDLAITKFNFLDFLKSIVRHRITHLMVVPPQVVLFCKHPAVKDYDFSHVRYLTSGAAPLSRELMERLIEIFPNAAIGQSYGTTESCTVISTWSLENKCDLSGSAGQLIPGITARVEKPDGTLAEFEEPGELVVRAPSLALGYAGNPEAWLRTGDEVKMNTKGEIFVLDRLKVRLETRLAGLSLTVFFYQEMLKVRGFQVAPAELEGCILDHPDVSDTCVVGVPDEYSGELPLAFVVLRSDAVSRMGGDPGAAERIKASIMKHVADNKVGYKRLGGGVEFVDVIPKNPSGKLLRRVLRDTAWNLIRRPVAKL